MSKICRNCGSEVQEMFCTNCGTPYSEPQNTVNNDAAYAQPSYEQPNYGQPNYGQPGYRQMPPVMPQQNKSGAAKVGAVFTIISVLVMTLFFVLFLTAEDFVREIAQGAAQSDMSIAIAIEAAWFNKLFVWLFVFWGVHTSLSVVSIVKAFKGDGSKVAFIVTLVKLGLLIIAFIMCAASASGLMTSASEAAAKGAAAIIYGTFAYVVMCIINSIFWLVSVILYGVGMGQEKKPAPMYY